MTTYPTPVGHVIPEGGIIPADVTGLTDCEGDPWVLSPRGHWHSPEDSCCSSSCLAGRKPLRWAPLTVTAVREPEPLQAVGGVYPVPGGVESGLAEPFEAKADPLVLSLPSVPEGAVALVFKQESGDIRFERKPDGWEFTDGAGLTHNWPLVDILDHFGSVSVVMREPRTWPEPPECPDDLKAVSDRHGEIHRRAEDRPSLWGEDRLFWSELLARGPLTEVFDEPGEAS